VNNYQQDLLLDVFDQCATVTAAHDQWKANQYSDGTVGNYAKRRAVNESCKSAYKKAVSDLCELYNHALGEGVSENLLDACCERHLPKGITILNGEVMV
jgi:hypothetical protein